MKKIVLLGLMIVGFIISNGCFAESDAKLKGAIVTKEQAAKDIFFFKKEIGLTDEQENKLKALVYDTQQSLGANRIKLDGLTADLSRMIKNKDNMGLIRKKLEEISRIQVDFSCVDIENGRKIESILSPDQLKKWNTIKERESSIK
jgi:hypothetical protein